MKGLVAVILIVVCWCIWRFRKMSHSMAMNEGCQTKVSHAANSADTSNHEVELDSGDSTNPNIEGINLAIDSSNFWAE